MPAKTVKAPSSPQDFKKKRKIGELLELPSGLVVKVRSVDLVSLVVSGKIPNSLLQTVQDHLSPLEGDKPGVEDGTELAKNMSPEDLAEVFSVMDSLVVAMAMEPQIHPEPENEDDRDETLLYVDEIDGEDKLFMFNWTQQGVKEMTRFPGGPQAGMAAMEESGSTKPKARKSAGSAAK
jgi:5,10-methylenetetrahydrofolate reductase